MNGELAKAQVSPLELASFRTLWRPGYLARPAQQGFWASRRGDGMIPWNRPEPTRTTTLCEVPKLYAMPARGSKLLYWLLSSSLGQVSDSQRRPKLTVMRLLARHLSCTYRPRSEERRVGKE